MVDWAKVAGNWKQIVGVLQEQWGDLTSDELMQVSGEKKQLIGALQKRYGMTERQAEKAIIEFLEQQRRLWDR